MPTTAPASTTAPNLGDTRIAFRQYTDRGLLRAYWLFRIIGIPWLNATGRALTQFALALHLPIKWAVKATLFKHFCGGETIDESLRTAQKLGDAGVGTILDYSVEGQEDDDSLDYTRDEILRTIKAAQQRKDIPFSVFKPTGLSPVHILEKVSASAQLSKEDAHEWELVQGRVLRICQAAHDAGI
ncbi:MAG TPA: proline dehydrogenase family protein, partial [Flavobacteriales bacterium]|nr:proline dehydrogenase family protein [Flavobacteriales bacterium]